MEVQCSALEVKGAKESNFFAGEGNYLLVSLLNICDGFIVQRICKL